MRALVVGASGYNGGLLSQRLVAENHWVRGMVRDRGRAPSGIHDVVVGDVTTGDGLAAALSDIDVAYYFVHSLDAVDHQRRDVAAARNFAVAARSAGVTRCVFFTTLAAPVGRNPSAYQRNRVDVENELMDCAPGLVAVRAGMVLGAQSRSMSPYVQLIQRAPLIPLGPWRHRRIAVVDHETVTRCLVHVGTTEAAVEPRVDIPASAVPTHEEFIRALMVALKVHKPIVRLPWTHPAIDAFLTARFTDDSYHFSRNLASVNQDDYVVDDARSGPFAHLSPLSLDAALELALIDSRS